MSAPLSSLEAPKLVVLDFDGVVLESNAIKDRVFSDLFETLLVKPRSHAGVSHQDLMTFHLRNNTVGRVEKFETVCRDLLGLLNPEPAIQECVSAFRNLTRTQLLQCDWVGGVIAFLETLKNRNIPVAIASATPQVELDWIISNRPPLGDLVEIWGGLPTLKPEMIRGFLSARNISPQCGLFIGDSPEDLETSQKVRIPFWGRKSRSPFEGAPFPVFVDFVGILSEFQKKGWV